MAARFVLVLMVLATLLPGISRAAAYLQGSIAPWSEVCSAAADGSRAMPLQDLRHFTEQCAACTLQSTQAALPPATPLPGAPALALAEAQPWRPGLAPQPLPVWATAQPRGPPLTA